MDELKALDAMGFSMPSPAWLVGSFIFSIIGFAAWRYGKKLSLDAVKWIGVVLMFYSYFVSDTWLLFAIGTGLCFALYFYRL